MSLLLLLVRRTDVSSSSSRSPDRCLCFDTYWIDLYFEYIHWNVLTIYVRNAKARSISKVIHYIHVSLVAKVLMSHVLVISNFIKEHFQYEYITETELPSHMIGLGNSLPLRAGYMIISLSQRQVNLICIYCNYHLILIMLCGRALIKPKLDYTCIRQTQQ